MPNADPVVRDDTPPGSTGNEDPKPEDRTINPGDHDRAVTDMLKYKGKLRDAGEAIQSLKDEISELKSNGLKEKEDYKSLYEQERDLHEETKRRAQRLEGSFYTTQKHSAVYPALKKAGLRDDAEGLLEMVNYDALEVETTSEGRVMINGTETFVDKFKADYPFAFEQKRPPKFNSAGGTSEVGTPQKVTPKTIIEIEMKHGRDSPQAKAAMAQFMEQRKQE